MNSDQMKKSFALLVVGFVFGAVFTYFGLNLADRLRRQGRASSEGGPICYSCFWQGYDPKLQADLVTFYRQYRTPDAIVSGDVQYILWRATGNANCDARQFYQRVAKNDPDLHRRYQSLAVLGFGAEKCGQNGSSCLQAASELAKQIGLPGEAALLDQISSGKLNPRFDKA